MEMGKLAIGLFETGESDRARSAALDGDLVKIPPHAGAPALRCRDTGVAHSGKSRPNGGVGGEKLVADHVVSGLQVIIAEGGGAVGNTGWAVLIVERTPDGAIFDLSHRGVEVARCFLAITPASEQCDKLKITPSGERSTILHVVDIQPAFAVPSRITWLDK